VAAFGASEVAADRVAGAELLQKDMAKRRREERLAAEAARRDAEEDGEDGEEDDDDVDDEGDLDASDEEDEDEEEGVSDEDEEEGASDEDEEEGASDEDEEEGASDSEDAAGLESDSDGRVVDPVTGKKRKRLAPALSMDEKRALAKELTAAAEQTGAPKPKVRKNGVLSLSELRRRAKEAARVKRESEAGALDDDDDSDSEKDLMIEHDRILQPEDFKRIKALRTATALGRALDKTGGKKAAETGAEEMRRMLRAADKSAQADRRVNPETLAAVGVKRAHDKESRVASIMAGREDRGVFGAAQDRKNKKSGGTSNVEKAKRKNLPLAARVKAAKNRRTSFVSKRVKDKQFKGRFRK
jgi:protein SDA1